MNAPEQKLITKEDLEALAEKMEVFAASLSPAERGLLGLAISNGARYKGQHGTEHSLLTPLANLLAQATHFREGQLSVPESIVRINPGKLRAKEESEFQGFKRET